ncbi:MAG: hypothetical protein R3E08_15165 [Thiotrichaceae bacterium]
MNELQLKGWRVCIIPNWEDIRRFNRPTIIELITDKSKAHHVTIVKLQGDVATLSFSGNLSISDQ